MSKIAVFAKEDLSKFGFDAPLFKNCGHDKIGGFEWHGPCLECGGKDRLVISNGLYWCRQCSFTGNLRKLLGEDYTSDPEALKYAAALEKSRQEQEKRARDMLIHELTASKIWLKYHRALLKMPKQIENLGKGSIPLLAIKQFKIGYNHDFYEGPSITFPIIWRDRCMNIRHRIIGKSTDKYRPCRTGLGLAFLNAVYPNDDTIVIVEGEKKAIALWAHKISSIGLYGVHSFYDHWVSWIQNSFEHRFVWFDDDNKAVRDTSELLAKKLEGEALHFGGKPDDLISDGIDINLILRAIEMKKGVL